jgi:hypothetical protein
VEAGHVQTTCEPKQNKQINKRIDNEKMQWKGEGRIDTTAWVGAGLERVKSVISGEKRIKKRQYLRKVAICTNKSETDRNV